MFLAHSATVHTLERFCGSVRALENCFPFLCTIVLECLRCATAVRYNFLRDNSCLRYDYYNVLAHAK